MTPLQPGIRVVSALRFHNPLAWIDRLRLNSGVEIDAGRTWPRSDWRLPSPDEVALLVAADADSGAALALFNLPLRLHAQWWELAAPEPAGAAQSATAFQGFAREILDYLQFKQLPLPPACTLEVLATTPGQPTTRPNGGGLTAVPPFDGWVGGINLADEEAGLVFLNLGDAQLPGSGTVHARAQLFLSGACDYPLVRIALRPGEGFWLPPAAIVVDGDTRGRQEIDVQLLIRSASPLFISPAAVEPAR